MGAELDYQWNLRSVMAEHGMYSTAALRPMLAERGISLSTSQVYRLVTERPERLSLKVLMALLDIFECRMEDLIEPVRAQQPSRSAASGAEPGLGSLRPKPARITR